MADPKAGDIVREKKYAQPLEVTRLVPYTRELEARPLDRPLVTPKRLNYDDVIPYKKE